MSLNYQEVFLLGIVYPNERHMAGDSRSDLGVILKQRRLTIPLTLQELASAAGVSSSHLGRIERGERFPSARILRKIAEPLRTEEAELMSLAGYLSSKQAATSENIGCMQLDPNVSMVLSKEPAEVQRAVVAILTIMKGLARRMYGKC